MENYDILFYFAIWCALAVGVAYVANNRGLSAVGYFLLALVFSPVIGIIAVLLSNPSQPATSKATELEQLAELKAKGALSEAEFEKAKAKVLA